MTSSNQIIQIKS